MNQVQRKLVLCNIDIAAVSALPGSQQFTPAVQIPSGSSKITVQFMYHGIDFPVGCTMYQSLDGVNFDECQTIDEMPVKIDLDIDSVSMTLNVSELLTSWIRFLVSVGDATTGTLDKFLVLFGS